MNKYETKNRAIKIPINSIFLEGILSVPKEASGIVIFAHGSGSSRLSPRNSFVAEYLQENGFATLLFDLLTEEEDRSYENRFDIDLLMERLEIVTDWVSKEPVTRKLKVGYFGASTGSAAAIKAAVGLENKISALVSRGGRPDLAAAEAADLRAPTLFIVGGNDRIVLELNSMIFDKIKTDKKFAIVPGATHLFEEKGALEEVARLSAEWFKKYL
ncbi:MAG: dienelactone hydrolase family protein [Patescibacteria group bacterium]|nr:dienelactone hydrolase family protein [Patescibacteria group bacterium]